MLHKGDKNEKKKGKTPLSNRSRDPATKQSKGTNGWCPHEYFKAAILLWSSDGIVSAQGGTCAPVSLSSRAERRVWPPLFSLFFFCPH